MNGYRDLSVWQRSFAVANQIMAICVDFPKEQRYILSTQIQRSAISVPSNIAEGYNRKSTKEYIQFLSIALGSLAEMETQLLIARQQSFVAAGAANELLAEMDEIGKMLRAMIKKLDEKQAA